MSRFQIIEAYPDSTKTPLTSDWLKNSDSETITPTANVYYILMADSGSYKQGDQFRWSGSTYSLIPYNEWAIIPDAYDPDSGGGGGSGGTSDYTELQNKPQINNVTLIGNKIGAQLGLVSEADLSDKLAQLGVYPVKILFDNTANWNSQTSLISEQNVVYIYTDYRSSGGHSIAGIKIGDGLAYVVDLPFLDTIYANHIADSTIHVTPEEKAFWNNKNRAYVSLTDPEMMILTIN